MVTAEPQPTVRTPQRPHRKTGWASRCQLAVRGLTATTLITAALFKMLGTNVSPFAEYGWVWQPSLQSLIVVGELLLGVWLLLPHSRFFSWLMATITFGTFATVSGYLGFLGQASCGCFGAIQTSPWWVFGLDIFILMGLMLARPSWTTWKQELVFVPFLIVALISAVGFGLWLHNSAGSVDAGLGALRGQKLVAISNILDFGTAHPGEILTQTLRLRNGSQEPIRLTGGTNDCTCRFGYTDIIIPAGETYHHKVVLRIPTDSQPGWHCRDAQLYSNSPTNPLVLVKLCVRIQQ